MNIGVVILKALATVVISFIFLQIMRRVGRKKDPWKTTMDQEAVVIAVYVIALAGIWH